MSASGAARKLERFASELGQPYGYERSFKICESGLLAERFLMTFHRQSCGSKLWSGLDHLGRQLQIPDTFAASLEDELSNADSHADIVHLGFENHPDGEVCKVYLEYAEDAKKQLSNATAGAPPVLVHVGYKWQPLNSYRRAITRYYGEPVLKWTQIRERVVRCYASEHTGQFAAPLSIANRLLATIESDVSADKIFFMQVADEDNTRVSFDLNLYRARWTLAKIAPHLKDMALYFGRDEQRLERLLQTAGDARLGHLAGGIDRHGKPFFSVYFGVEDRGR